MRRTAACLRFLALSASGLLLAGLAACRQEPTGTNEGEKVVARHAQEPASAVPRPTPPIDRAALLMAVGKARSAAAAGVDDREAQRSLDGKQFKVRIRFGCDGPAAELKEGDLGWRIDPEQRVLRIRAAPTIGGKDPTAAAVASNRIEAVEGFWLPHPWLFGAACPAKTPAGERAEGPANPAGVVAPRVGIAEFFTADDSRTNRRRGGAYEATKTLGEGAAPGGQGFALVLSGRLKALPGGKVIHCVVAAGRPPDCIVSARIDRLWLEEPGKAEKIAEWTD